VNAIRVIEVYPQLLGTYADRGNALALRQRAGARGLRVDLHVVRPGESVPLDGDLYLLGGGEDAAQALAASMLQTDGGLARAVERGRTVLAVCAGMQILGTTFVGPDDAVLTGLGLVDAEATALVSRATGDIVTRAQLDGEALTLVGFENHRIGSRLGSACRPLGRVERGRGNHDTDRTEGLVQGSIVATYLHGPLLALNPQLADVLLRRVAGALPALDPTHEDWAHTARAVRLREGSAGGLRRLAGLLRVRQR
jgi:CobQ-like glutamine amidotransferase family enzyme